MHEWPGQDPTAVRATDLASAAAVVVRFRRRRKATVAAALSVGVAMFVSSQGMFRMTTTSLVPTETPPTSVPGPGFGEPTVTPSPEPPAQGVPGSAGGAPPRSAPPVLGAPAAEAGEPFADGRRGPARGRFRIPVVRQSMYAGDLTNTNCGFNPIPATASLCLSSRASQQKNGSVVLTYTACQRQPSLADAVLTFETGKEVDFAIKKNGRVVWQWSTGQRFAPGVRKVVIDRTACAQWRTRWTGVLDDGTRVPPGEYELRAAGRDERKVLVVRRALFAVKF